MVTPVPAAALRNEIDPYTMYNDLNGDSTAQSADDCKANCCKDANCQVWQWSDVRYTDRPVYSDRTHLAAGPMSATRPLRRRQNTKNLAHLNPLTPFFVGSDDSAQLLVWQ